jgi:hypothetical protein
MAISQDALQGMLASATSVVYLECITINHSTFEAPIRLVNDRQECVRTSGTFLPFPFLVTPPAQTNDRAPALDITADMVDQRIMLGLRPLVGHRERATITYEVITAQHPNTVEWGPIEFSLDSVSTDGVATIKLRASFSLGLLGDAFPKLLFTPGNRGGL